MRSSSSSVIGCEDSVTYPVELLRDRKGIYGIGLAKGAKGDYSLKDLLLRPDHLVAGGHGRAVLQMLPDRVAPRLFRGMREERLREKIHNEMLRRAGVPQDWSRPNDELEIENVDFQNGDGGKYEPVDEQQQIRNRQKYYGIRVGSLSAINRLIAKALEEAALPEAIRQARRFPFAYRYGIYRLGASSPRMLQLIEAFPALALALDNLSSTFDPQGQIRGEAMALVERGARLRQIADLLKLPMAFRAVKPGAAHLAFSVEGELASKQSLMYAFLPDSLPSMKLWFNGIRFASELGPEFVEWTARHALEISSNVRELDSFLINVKDWVRACQRLGVPSHTRQAVPRDALFPSRADELVTRPFKSDMSLRTVIQLSYEWHEAVGNALDGEFCQFPDPWCHGGRIGEYEIVPITDSTELYREGAAMHHCVAAYRDSVLHGASYIYSIRKQGNRVATAELSRPQGSPTLRQLSGPCNGKVPKDIKRAVQKWLHCQTEFRLSKNSDVVSPF